jgi:hypothetical protein
MSWPFSGMFDLLSDFLGWLALAGGGPSLIRGDADGGDGSTVHACETDEIAVGISHRDDHSLSASAKLFRR